jgi:hypothetical protein
LLTTNFNAGTAGKVRVRNTGSSGYVVADAVQFIPTSSLPQVNVWAADANAYRSGEPGKLVVSRSGNTNGSLTVLLSCSGTATNGVDYTALPSSVTFSAGSTFSNLVVAPLARSTPVGLKTATVSVVSDLAYALGALSSAAVNIHDAPYWDWSFEQFGASATNFAVSAETAAPAGDGVPNFAKYALGLNPLLPAANPPIAIASALDTNGFFGLSYSRPDPIPAGTTYLLESSTDLLSWCGTTNCVEVSEIRYNPNATATVTCRLKPAVSAGAAGYLRLRITQ